MINLHLNGTIRTLILTLRARADEQAHDSPLINDEWSTEWNKFVPEEMLLDAWYNRSFQLATAIRSRLIDDAVIEFLDAHDDALVVELGAGLSTRYFRLGKGKATWIELDFDKAINARRKLDVEVEDHWFIGSDMTQLDWIDLLPAVKAKNILFIAEGTLMFVEQEGIENLFDTLAEQFKGATFVFDVANPDYIDRSHDDFMTINAPMHWGVTEKDLKQYPLKVKDTKYLLLEFPERWEEIGIDASKRTKDRSGYVVTAKLG
ncbi:MAG: hypothetical protein Phog2KO_36880 [Phototrophicaceae bacterium]